MNKLTPKQTAKFPAYREKWLKIGLDTTPLTIKQARPIVDALYKHILQKPKPEKILIFDNPFDAARAVGEIVGHKKKLVAEPTVFVWPYIDGQFSAGQFAFYDFIFTELIKPETKLWDVFRATSQLSLTYPLDKVCILCQKPSKLVFKNNQLHCETGPAIQYKNFELYFLHGVRVPDWLVMTRSEELDCMKICEFNNAEQRREFVRKVGLERLKYKLGSKIIDKEMVDLVTPNGPTSLTYCLLDLDFRTTVRRVLELENPSLPGVFHVEYVPSTVKTIHEAMNFRLSRLEDIIDDENGSDWYLQGDVIILPEEFTKLKRWPTIIA